MSDESTAPPPDGDDTAPFPEAGETPSGPSGLETSLSERLNALDRLYESNQITATELGEARRRILGEGPAAIAPAAAAASQPVQAEVLRAEAAPPAAPPPPVPPRRVDGGHIGPPEPPPPAKIAGLPVWAATLIGVLVLGMIAIGGFLLLSGGDDEGNENLAAGASAETYATQINRPLDQLTKSAVATGKSLARVSEPGEIRQLNRTAERQLDVVETARGSLTRISVTEADQRAHRSLIAAAANQRRYLVALGRASSGEPTQAKLRQINQARRAGAATVASYRTFFQLAPGAPDAITTTDLADTAGLRSATQSAIADAEAPPPSRSGGSTTRSPGPYNSPSFQSPTGNLRCQLSGGTLFCSSSNDGFGVALPSVGSPSTGSGVASGGQVVPYGSRWQSGVFTCDSAFDGITCRNASGNGFFLNRDQYNPF
ncbi:hypothetical protein [Miltoncostaea oceani]|uniref:hypothetical protein n=1 Tax=Miltoncostaea oceani TaxID=2843216 RepID=UPI001C3C8D7D|nr:hypothetical protein [Miltoncostaea oceani]